MRSATAALLGVGRVLVLVLVLVGSGEGLGLLESWNWGSAKSDEGVLVPFVFVMFCALGMERELLGRDSEERVVLCPSLWIARWTSEGCWFSLIVCLLDASGIFRPKRDSKESLLRYVSKADIRAAPRPAVGGSENG